MICPNAKEMSLDQFKLFCRYCQVFFQRKPFERQTFESAFEPVSFKLKPDLNIKGNEAIKRLHEQKKAEEASQQARQNFSPYDQGQKPANNQYPPIFSNQQGPPFQSNYNNPTNQFQGYGLNPTPSTTQFSSNSSNTQQFGSQGSQQQNQGNYQQSYGQPQNPYSQPQTPTSYNQPSTPVSGDQTLNDASFTTQARASLPVSADDFTVTGTDPVRVSSSDLVAIRSTVEKIPVAQSDKYKFTELKNIILSFKVKDTKLVTKLWKQVDPSNSKEITQEGAVTIFWFLALDRKGIPIPTELPENWKRYVQNKTLPYELGPTHLGGSAGPAQTGVDIEAKFRALEKQYEAFNSSSSDSLEKFRNTSSSIMSRQTEDVRLIKLILSSVQQQRSQLANENKTLSTELQRIKSFQGSQNSLTLVKSLIQDSERKVNHTATIISRLADDATMLSNEHKYLEDKYNVEVQKNEEQTQKIKDYENQGFQNNFGGANFSDATHAAQDASKNIQLATPEGQNSSPIHRDHPFPVLAPTTSANPQMPDFSQPKETKPEAQSIVTEHNNEEDNEDFFASNPTQDVIHQAGDDSEDDMFGNDKPEPQETQQHQKSTSNHSSPAHHSNQGSATHGSQTTSQPHSPNHPPAETSTNQPAPATNQNAHNDDEDDDDMFGDDDTKDQPAQPKDESKNLEELVKKASGDENNIKQVDSNNNQHNQEQSDDDDDFFGDRMDESKFNDAKF